MGTDKKCEGILCDDKCVCEKGTTKVSHRISHSDGAGGTVTKHFECTTLTATMTAIVQYIADNELSEKTLYELYILTESTA